MKAVGFEQTSKTPELVLADWLEELAVFGTPRRFHDAETAHHLCEAIRYWRLVKLATAPPLAGQRNLAFGEKLLG